MGAEAQRVVCPDWYFLRLCMVGSVSFLMAIIFYPRHLTYIELLQVLGLRCHK